MDRVYIGRGCLGREGAGEKGSRGELRLQTTAGSCMAESGVMTGGKFQSGIIWAL
jgi:hypothetical protein